MKDVYHGLKKWWQRLGLPVYWEGTLPPTAAQPCITLEPFIRLWGQKGMVIARIWFHGTEAAAQRRDFMTRLETILPSWGSSMPTEKHLLLLERGDAFLQEKALPDRRNWLGLRIEVDLRVFTTKD